MKENIFIFMVSLLIVGFGAILLEDHASFAQNSNQDIIEQIKKFGPGTRFVIPQIQPIKGHKITGFAPITFTGPANFEGDLPWVADGMTMAGNGTIIRFTNKTPFGAETLNMGPYKVYLPQNIKGFTFDSQSDNPLTFVLLENYGLTYVSGYGSVTLSNGQLFNLPKENITSKETNINIDSPTGQKKQDKNNNEFIGTISEGNVSLSQSITDPEQSVSAKVLLSLKEYPNYIFIISYRAAANCELVIAPKPTSRTGVFEYSGDFNGEGYTVKLTKEVGVAQMTIVGQPKYVNILSCEKLNRN